MVATFRGADPNKRQQLAPSSGPGALKGQRTSPPHGAPSLFLRAPKHPPPHRQAPSPALLPRLRKENLTESLPSREQRLPPLQRKMAATSGVKAVPSTPVAPRDQRPSAAPAERGGSGHCHPVLSEHRPSGGPPSRVCSFFLLRRRGLRAPASTKWRAPGQLPDGCLSSEERPGPNT